MPILKQKAACVAQLHREGIFALSPGTQPVILEGRGPGNKKGTVEILFKGALSGIILFIFRDGRCNARAFIISLILIHLHSHYPKVINSHLSSIDSNIK